MSNEDGYSFWCSSCKQDHAGECAQPAKASGEAMAAQESYLEKLYGITFGYPNALVAIGPDTTGSCPDQDCPYCRTGKYSGT